MKFIELPQTLKQKVENLYILKGDDSFVIDSAIKHINNACGNEMPDFNKSFFDNENFSATKIQESINMLPFGNDRKFILIKQIEKISDSDKKLLTQTFETMPSTTTVAVVYTDVWKFLKDGVIVDCSKQSFDLLSKYIKVEVSKNNLVISSDAIKTLIEICGFNLTNISNELKKLIPYCEDEIVSDDIISLVDPDIEFQIFELTENLGSKNATKSLEILSNFLSRKEPVQNLFSLISNHFRRLAHSSFSTAPADELANLLGVKEYAIIKARQQAKFFSKAQLKNILSTLEEIDNMIKSGKMASENAIYYLIFKILYC
ncbi:MAG: DNA polymerase III subunit delta [Christensenellales bacterium]